MTVFDVVETATQKKTTYVILEDYNNVVEQLQSERERNQKLQEENDYLKSVMIQEASKIQAIIAIESESKEK